MVFKGHVQALNLHAQDLLVDLRSHPDQLPTLGVPSGPNSGLSVHLPWGRLIVCRGDSSMPSVVMSSTGVLHEMVQVSP